MVLYMPTPEKYRKNVPDKNGVDMGMGKLAPQAVAEEEVVLGILLMFSDELSKVSEIVTKESFYKEGNQLIYESIIALSDRNAPVNIITVTQELKGGGKLENVGGPFAISQLTSRVVSSANLEYYARIVQEKYLQRAMIRAASDLVKASYDETNDVIQTLWEFSNKADKLKDSVLVKDTNINGNTPLIAEDKIMTFQGRKILSIGNVCALVAPPGTGKSQVCEAAAASIVNPYVDTLGFKIQKVSSGDNGVLYIDTERSKNDCIRGFNRILNRVDVQTNKELLKKNGDLEGLTYRSFVEIADKKMRRVRIENYIRSGGFRVLILDGITDLIRDTNDIGEAGDVVSWLISLANLYSIGVFVTIHDNPVNGQTKPRGHIGSELYRKVEGMLLLRRSMEDKDMRNLTTDFNFGKVRNEKDTGMDTFFKWSDAHSMFMSEKFEPTSYTGEMNVVMGHFEKIFAGSKGGLKRNDLIDKLKAIIKKSDKKCSDLIADAIIREVVELNSETKLYNLMGMGDVPF